MNTMIKWSTLTTILLMILHFQNTFIFHGNQFIITNRNYMNMSPWSSIWQWWWWCMEQWLAFSDKMEYLRLHRLWGPEPYRLLAILQVLPASNQRTPGRPAPSAKDILKRKCRHLDPIIVTGSEFVIFFHVDKLLDIGCSLCFQNNDLCFIDIKSWLVAYS